jgi:FkbM family methyltransferase
MTIIGRLLEKLRRAATGLVYSPKVEIDDLGPLIRLGSEYGGWTLRDDPSLNSAVVVSGGLGEDASFDVELAKRFGATLIMVDPTPRAIAHYAALMEGLGRSRSQDYVPGGNQPVAAYPLDGVCAEQLVLVARALWTEEGTLKFFQPENPANVSHSISNFQNRYAGDTPAIEVESMTLAALMQQFGLAELPLLKLDIEGAEVEVLADMLDRRIHPAQLLVEFDELSLRTRRALTRWQAIDKRLRQAGYRCGYFDGRSCFLYALPS